MEEEGAMMGPVGVCVYGGVSAVQCRQHPSRGVLPPTCASLLAACGLQGVRHAPTRVPTRGDWKKHPRPPSS